MKNVTGKILILSIFLTINSLAQVDTVWVKRINGPINSADAGRLVKVGPDGFVYVIGDISKAIDYSEAVLIKFTTSGDTVWSRYYSNPFNLTSYFTDFDFDINGNIIITGNSLGVNLSDIITLKFDANGNLIWAKRFDDGDDDKAYAITSDENGNIYVTGSSWKVFESDNSITIKFNQNGDMVWTKTWNDTLNGTDVTKGIVKDIDGNIIVAGNCLGNYGSSDFLIIKLNSSGTILWQKEYDSPEQNSEEFKAITSDNVGNIYLTGNTFNNASGTNDILTIKYNSNGDTIWTRRYYGTQTGEDNVNAMKVDSIGNVYLVGQSFVTGNGLDCLTMKYNSAGNLLWSKTYGDYYQDGLQSMTLDKSGNIYATGTVKTSSINTAYLTLKYDSEGNQKWLIKYDGTQYNGYDAATSVSIDDKNQVYITGSSAGLNTGLDIVTIKYTQGPSNIIDEDNVIPLDFELYQNYPNPFNPSTTISWQSPVSSWQIIKLYDLMGREIETIADGYYGAGSHSTLFIVNSSLPSGVYFYQLRAGDYIQTKKMLLLK